MNPAGWMFFKAVSKSAYRKVNLVRLLLSLLPGKERSRKGAY